ncbi:DUF3489 domain-containing protein [Sulfitobacter sp. JBTF-M27]|jgi:hypothetical protein|uniref:DUF3489 domain-containing protein n=1 Tax=Sulfitobacter sediminilitoris TaxID=2698830 RepID=A0A6P0CGW7_9RHOB|nr:DUF3489 domain-containing protein [Sulfitobacter sediminilitoris]NEK25177.1 DUF3489 domain-containing protein [Sulfitobacter sediminilitoris]
MTTLDLEPQKTAIPKTVVKKPTRQAQLHKLLTRKSGVTIAQLQKSFGWQPHTARAAISAQRKAGCVVARTVTDKGSVYRIVAGQGDR